MEKTTEKFALITGASSGIGLELAKLFAKDGYNLVIVSRRLEDLMATSQILKEINNIQVVPLVKDLFQKNAAFELHGLILAKGIKINVLVNNAGQGQYGEFVDNDIHRELDIIQLNVNSLVILTKLFLKEMVARNEGMILNVSSVASKAPGPLQAVYHATKAFVQSFSEAIRDEVKETEVIITTLLPGATETAFFNKAGMQNARNVVEGELADPADVAADGYKALMKGKDMVVSGFKNKVEVAMAGIIPDTALAAKVHKQQEPVDKAAGK